MQVGSLIFLAIVATWAVYLLQHWIRRREDAAATRSADRYTEAMRVLEKRVPTPAVETPGSPFVARRATQPPPSRIAEVATMSSSPTPTTTSARRTTAAGSTACTTPAGTTGRSRPVERSRPADRPTDRPTTSRWRRQLRGVVLLLALLWAPTSVVLALLHVLLWISVPLAVLTLAAVLVWLRFEARADRDRARGAAAARAGSVRSGASHPGSASTAADRAGSVRPGASRGSRRPAAGTERPSASRPGRRADKRAGSRPKGDDTEVIHLGAGGTTGTGAATDAGGTTGTGAGGTTGTDDAAQVPSSRSSGAPAPSSAPTQADEPARADGTVRREARSAAYDFEAELARDASAAPAPQPAPEGTWSPVPVPPPTYTMKAKAEPRMTSAGIPADVFATPEFAEEAEELDERALFARRAAGS